MIFESNHRYSLSVFFSSFLMLICSAISIFYLLHNEFFNSILFAIVPFVIAVGYLFIIPREISITNQYVHYKTILLFRSIPITSIKSVKEAYSTKSMIWYSGYKDRAHMLCSVRYGKFPLAFFLIHNGISNYKKAVELLKNIINTHNQAFERTR
jgi:hypothetical protein